jgi:hypothetical protein
MKKFSTNINSFQIFEKKILNTLKISEKSYFNQLGKKNKDYMMPNSRNFHKKFKSKIYQIIK